MIRLSGFADEIGDDPAFQIQTLLGENLKFLELRAAWGINVLDLSDGQRRELRQRLADAGIGVSSIASPVGKVRIDEPWPAPLERLKIALDAAEHFGAPYIRLFSYYPPPGGQIADHRQEVLRRLNEQVALARGRRVQLLHENEKEIYGEGAEASLDIAQNVPGMGLIFDPANFVQAGVRPIEAWALLADHVKYFHIKDAILGGGEVVLPGAGDGSVEPILRSAILARGYDGFLSLEPHLTVSCKSSGFSGPDLFVKAVRTLKQMLDRMGATYE
jgi:sugar phosphate isomerase/epimerase